MSDNISQWHSSAGETISKCGSRASATARLRGNSKYLEAASNISSACSVIMIKKVLDQKTKTKNQKTREKYKSKVMAIVNVIISFDQHMTPDEGLYPSNHQYTCTNQGFKIRHMTIKYEANIKRT